MAPFTDVNGLSKTAISLIGIVASLAFSPILMRISLILPAVAVDQPISIKEAWRNGRGLGIPMALANLGIAALFWILNFILNALFSPQALEPFIKNFLTLGFVFLEPAVDMLEWAFLDAVVIGGNYVMHQKRGET